MYRAGYATSVNKLKDYKMTTRLQQLYTTEKMNQIDCRNINLLTMLSKLAMVMVLGIVVMIISLIS